MKIWKIDNYEDYFNLIIKISEDKLKNSISEKEIEKFYSEYFEIPKKHGKRKIYIINGESDLFKVQKNIKNNFLDNIMLSDACYGFRKGYSYYDFLSPHKAFYEEKYFLRVDIKNFFSSIKYSLIKDVMNYYFVVGDNLNKDQKKKILEYTLMAMTYRKKVVQGAVTSPTLANIIFRQLDLRIEKYCRKSDIMYTRYADDLLFSSYDRRISSKAFLYMIDKILNSKGFKINYSKTIRTQNEISINGYVISDKIRLSRKKLESLNRVLFHIETNEWKNHSNDFEKLNKKLESEGDTRSFNGKYSLLNFFSGYRAFIISALNESDDDYFVKKYQRYIERIENKIKKIESLKPRKT